MSDRRDRRPASERRVRSAWNGQAGPLLRAGGCVFGFAADLRNLLYDTGVLPGAVPALPVISVGGLTVGGSGKTPIAAAAGRWLCDAGIRVAIVTRGFYDELRVHRALNDSALVLGAPDRARAVVRAAELGASAAVLDDGFQHRRLRRRVEVVAVDLDALRGGDLRRLPAGPFRARWAEIGRADAIVISRREGGAAASRVLRGRLRRRTAARVVAECRLVPGGLRPVNDRAREIEDPAPSVAVASIMKPETFFRQLRRRGVTPAREYVFSDHAAPDRSTSEEMVEAAGRDGLVGTLKDAGRLESVAAGRTPVWYLEDRIEWEREGESLRRQLVRMIRHASVRERSRTGAGVESRG